MQAESLKATTVAHRGTFEPKIFFSLFFKSNGSVLIHAVDEDKIVDHNFYIQGCLKLVVTEIRKKQKSPRTKAIELLHDDARPHTYSDVISYLTKDGIIIMPHPPYSPDLDPYDYWLNDYIKQNLLTNQMKNH